MISALLAGFKGVCRARRARPGWSLMAAAFLTWAFAVGALAADWTPVKRGIPLQGAFKLSMVAPPYERPADDSPAWVAGHLGEEGLTTEFPRQEGVAWVVLKFSLPVGASFDEPALYISHPADGEEIFINGRPVGGEGRISDSYQVTPFGPRFLLLPPDVLRTGENELSMKVLFAGFNVDYFSGPIYLGDSYDLHKAWSEHHSEGISSEAAILSFYVTALAVFIIIYFKNTKEHQYFLFILLLLSNIASILIFSHFMYGHEYYPEWFTYLRRLITPLRSAVMILLVVSLSRAKTGKLFWTLLAFCMGFALLELTTPPLKALTELLLAYKVFLLILAGYFLLVAVQGVLSKKDGAWPIMIGISSYAAGSRLDLFWGTYLRHYAIVVFVLCMFYVLASRHARLGKRLAELSGKLLDAHEQERNRLAREMHDGVGQSLLGLKLKIQLLQKKALAGDGLSHETLDSLSRDTSNIIEEVRRTSMDLRPSFVANTTLYEALSWYANSFLREQPLELHFYSGSEKMAEPSLRVKDNLYRIFQEILSNTLKHSQATRLDVSLYQKGASLFLLTTDNGKGFSTNDPNRRGMGLTTMAERAELLGGSCLVESRPGNGTTIRIEVPFS